MRRSLTCDTVWAQVLLTRSAASRLKGRIVEITVSRPSDGRLAPYPLELRGRTVGYGNQLGARRASRQKPSFSAAMGAPADRSLEPDAASSPRTPARRLTMSSGCLVAPASRFGPLRHLAFKVRPAPRYASQRVLASLLI